ncbi:MAG: glycosyltransferase family 1 protein [Chloroflexi bacterium]|nr:MAG: glycosyltransferase family 1 protein [Chloroflexota bacterium]
MDPNFDIICISTQEWDDLWTRKQRFFQHLARQGHRVLYVERQLHLLGYVNYFKSQWRRIYRWLQPPRQIEPNLFLVSPPLLLPFFLMYPAINRLNARILRPFIRRQMRRLGVENPVLWIYPLNSFELAGAFGERLRVYDCVDEWSAFKGLLRPDVMRNYEQALIRASDVVLVTRPELLAEREPLARRVHWVPNAAEIEHFAATLRPETDIPADIAALPQPVIGFVGSVQYWLDFDLLQFLAESRPGWSFVFVGPVGHRAAVESLSALPNVHLLGRRPYAQLPGYIKAFRACLNPFKTDSLGTATDPLKLYEYLATGKPVVSVDIPAARRFAPVVRIGSTAADFLAELDDIVANGHPRQAEQLALAQQHTWQARFAQVEEILREALDENRN